MRRPLLAAAIAIASLLAGLALVSGSGAGFDGELSRHTRAAAALQAPTVSPPAGSVPPGGTAGEHIPPQFTAIICAQLLQTAAQIVQQFNALIAALPAFAAILIAARDAALAQINVQLNAFHCVVSPG